MGHGTANDVPLQSGVNSIPVILTAPDSTQTTQTLSVTSTASRPFRFSTYILGVDSSTTGLAPLSVQFSIADVAQIAATRVDLSCFGDGTVSQSTSDPTLRSQDLGLMYQSLGQVVHHLEDMAQPQHARDEAHCDYPAVCEVPGALFGLYHPSAYEAYMLFCTVTSAPNCPLLSGNYGAVFDQNNPSNNKMFQMPRDFWTESAQGNGGSPSYGLAEYTNAGFVGARTNFQGTPTALLPASSSLPLPSGAGGVPHQDSVVNLFGSGFPVTATMGFISTPVTDYYTNTTTTNPRTTAYSVLTFDLLGLDFARCTR